METLIPFNQNEFSTGNYIAVMPMNIQKNDNEHFPVRALHPLGGVAHTFTEDGRFSINEVESTLFMVKKTK